MSRKRIHGVKTTQITNQKEFQTKCQKLNNPIKPPKPKFQNPQTEKRKKKKKINQQLIGYHPK
jgi:hypothetical protein